MFEKLEDLSQKVTNARQKFEALQEQGVRVGLNANASKTKELRIRSRANTGDIVCSGKALEQVSLYIPRQYCHHNRGYKGRC